MSASGQQGPNQPATVRSRPGSSLLHGGHDPPPNKPNTPRRRLRPRRPPVITEKLLRWSLPAGILRESVVGDLREELSHGWVGSRMA